MSRFQSYQARKAITVPKAIVFTKQFPKNFLRPYGRVEEAPTSSLVFHRTHEQNCEWYTRPATAASELAQTVIDNVLFLQEKTSQLLPLANKQELLDLLKPLEKALHYFNQKDPSRPETGKKEVKALLKLLIEDNDDLDTALQDAFSMGGALYSLAINILVARSILQDPNRYATKITAKPEHKKFKDVASIKEMKLMFEELCITPKSTKTTDESGRKRSLVIELDSSNDDSEKGDKETTPRAKKPRKSKEQELVSSSEEQSSDESSEDDVDDDEPVTTKAVPEQKKDESPKKAKKSKKKEKVTEEAPKAKKTKVKPSAPPLAPPPPKAKKTVVKTPAPAPAPKTKKAKQKK